MGVFNWICGTTTLTEFQRRKTPMGIWVDYHCSACEHHISLPDQQRFHFCYLCGARVIKIRRKKKGSEYYESHNNKKQYRAKCAL